MTTPTFNVADLFELVAAEVPDRPALVAGTERRTYGELDRRTNRLARALIERGAEPGTKVGIYAWNRVEWVEAAMAAYKARAVPININYRYVADELRYLLDDADIEVLVFERSFSPSVAELRPDLPLLRHLLVLEDGSDVPVPEGAEPYEEVLAAQDDDPLGIQRSPDDLYMLYTGGTTGMPKGVMWRHEDVYFSALGGNGYGGAPPVTSIEDVVARIAPEENALRGMTIAPVMHGAAQWAVLIALLSGGCPVLYTERGFDPDAVWKIVEAERCNTVMLVGDAMARPLVEALADEDGKLRYDVSSVFSIGSGGAVFSPTVQDQFRALLPGAFVMDTIGASEMGAGGMSAPGGVRRFAGSQGTEVLDDDLRPVEPGSGVIGRFVRGGHIPLGYWKDEAKTAATFVTDADGRRWVMPGDLALREADGTITLLGRGSQCINTGGEKVYPEEVEEALKSHPAVFDTLVVGVPDDRFGEHVAAVVALRDGEPEPDDLTEHCRRHVAGYKVPREYRFVDAIQRTPAGKADYRWAKARFG